MCTVYEFTTCLPQPPEAKRKVSRTLEARTQMLLYGAVSHYIHDLVWLVCGV